MYVLVFSGPGRTLIRNDEEIVALAVTIRVVQDTLCTVLISAGATTLLDVTFQRFRHRVMYHKPHILLVDTHTKSNCRNNDLDLISHPSILYFFTLIVRQFCMVVITLHLVVSFKNLREFLTLLAGNAIYDAGFSAESSPQHLH